MIPFVFLLLFSPSSEGKGIEMDGPMPIPCPGYCGRTPLNITAMAPNYYEDIVQHCQSCPWGERADESYSTWCRSCHESPSSYDYLYLLFIFSIPLVIYIFILHSNMNNNSSNHVELAEGGCCLLECSLSAFFTLLLFRPLGLLSLESCRVQEIRQFYPWMYNPLHEGVTMHCTHEIVYPLYTLPFVYLLFCMINTVILRGCLYLTLLRKKNEEPTSMYASLYTLPWIAFALAIFAGLLYYTFPIVTVIYSLPAQALQLAHLKAKNRRELVHLLLSSPSHTILLIANALLVLFPITSLSIRLGISVIPFGLLSILIIPLPSLYYLAFFNLTHPNAQKLVD